MTWVDCACNFAAESEEEEEEEEGGKKLRLRRDGWKKESRLEFEKAKCDIDKERNTKISHAERKKERSNTYTYVHTHIYIPNYTNYPYGDIKKSKKENSFLSAKLQCLPDFL